MKTVIAILERPPHTIFVLVVACLFSSLLVGQEQASKPAGASGTGTRPATTQQTKSSSPLKVTTHLVTVEVVAKDKRGDIMRDLSAKDFQVFEEVLPKKNQHEQKISDFEAVNHAGGANSKPTAAPKIPAGVYTNLVTTRLPVPPTILLLDGLNTDVDSGMQARRQMVKLLASVPPDSPVAVFTLGRELRLLQSFTKDPKLLREAAQHVLSMDNAGLATIDARDDPNSLSNLTQSMFGQPGQDEAPPQPAQSSASAAAGPSGPPGGELQMRVIEQFEKEVFAASADIRVRTTLEALRAIARHVSGYPGRKNLLWISSSFPIAIGADPTAQHNLGFEGVRDYEREVASTTNALADAKLAVYPVNPAGVQTQSYFQASSRPVGVSAGAVPYAERNALRRESLARFSSEESMTDVAQQTGGKVCLNNNDLADCVQTAMAEGSSYYELSYYPDAGDWRGEFHRIIVKSSRPGVHLTYRQGYYARSTESTMNADEKSAGNDPQLQDAACQDLLTSTSVLLVARQIPPDQAGQVKYFMAIDARMITFAAVDETSHEVRLSLAVCTFDRTGKPLQYLQDKREQKFNEKEFAAVKTRGVAHAIQFAAKPGTARVRLLVRDSFSSSLGSVDIPYAEIAVANVGQPTAPAAAPTPH